MALLLVPPKLTRLLKLSTAGFEVEDFGAAKPDGCVERGVLRAEAWGDGLGRKVGYAVGGFISFGGKALVLVVPFPGAVVDDQSRLERSSMVM